MTRLITDAFDSLGPEALTELRRLEDRIARLEAMYAEGFGSPEGVVVGRPGRVYHRLDGGAATSFYVFEGTSGDVTGWAAK